MAIRVFKRYEKKYLVSEEQLKAMLPEIEQYMDADAYSTDGKRYSIYNIYYDTENYDLIRKSMDRPYYKEKFRLRAYEPFGDGDRRVYMEMKKKIGGVVSKRRTAAKLSDAVEFIENGVRPETKKPVEKQVLNEMEYFMSLNALKNALFISYERMAFFGKEDKELRVTFDCRINARKERVFSDDTEGNVSLLEDGKYIMEVKVSDAIPYWLTELMTRHGVRKVSFSKYGTAYAMGLCGRA